MKISTLFIFYILSGIWGTALALVVVLSRGVIRRRKQKRKNFRSKIERREAPPELSFCMLKGNLVYFYKLEKTVPLDDCPPELRDTIVKDKLGGKFR